MKIKKIGWGRVDGGQGGCEQRIEVLVKFKNSWGSLGTVGVGVSV